MNRDHNRRQQCAQESREGDEQANRVSSISANAQNCTDNGAQIAALGSAAVRAGVAPSPMDFAPDSGMPLDVSVAH